MLAACGWAQAGPTVVVDPGPPYALSEYGAALDSWITFYDNAPDKGCCVAPDEGLPRNIVVREQGQEFRVRLPELKPHETDDDLSAEEAGKLNREQVLAQLRLLRTGLRQYETQTLPASAAARTTAERILAGREYRQVRLPGMKESWRDQAVQWLVGKLAGLFDRTPDLRSAARLLVWSIIGLTVIAAGIFIWKLLQREEGNPRWQLGSAPAPVSAKPWERWLEEARQSAAASQWRQAIRLAYWAAISALESRGTWKPDAARTPREYLTLVSTQQPPGQTLLTLTRDFERVWYAQQPATQDDFEKTLRHLSELGCR